jgi:hypothetical protein
MILAAMGSFVAAGCGDDTVAPPSPQTFEVTIENVSTVYDFAATGTFDTPAGEASPGPIFPGGVYQFDFSAAPGSRLSFATMFVQSNDWFYAPDGEGIALWDAGGSQVSGDITSQLYLWDAGSEEDQEPGLGADQAPRQAGPDTGADDDDTTVRLASDDWGNIPAMTDVVRVTLNPTGDTSFRVLIENVSDATTLTTSDAMTHPVPLAPGVWVVHTADDPLFTSGANERGEGLAGLAEDGDVSALASALDARTGLTGPIAPGVFAVHRGPSALFMAGMADAGEGLEALAEDGDPSGLAAALGSNADVSESGAFDTPVGGSAPAPAFPGEAYTFQFTAEPGDRLSLATMLVQTNDLFYAPAEAGLDLFPGGTAVSGDLTGMFLLWDAGTEVNERPGVGLNQAPRQTGPDTGATEGGTVRQVNDGYRYPAVDEVIEVSIEVVN